MIRSGRSRALALGLWLAAGPLTSLAQEAPKEEPAAPARAPSEAPPAEPVPLSRVVEQGEAVVRSARKTGALSRPEPEIAAIEAELPEQSAQLRERELRAKTLAADPPSLVALEEEIKTFELVREEFDKTLTLLTTRLTQLEAALYDLGRENDVWRVTEGAARHADAPGSVVTSIRAVREALREAEGSLAKRRDELLSLQALVGQEEQRARASLESLREARDSFRSLFLLRDSRPYWNAADSGRSELFPKLRETLGVRWRALRRFVEVRRERLGTQLLLLAAALAATLTLRRRASAWRADDPRLAASAVVFERPFSAAMLLAVSLTPLLHPRAPRLADAIGVLLVVIPALRLLPRLLDPALAPAVYALATFAVVDRVRDVVQRSVFFERTVLLVETAAALVFLGWMLRPARLASLPPGVRIPLALGRALQATLALLALGTVANLAGWVNLSRLLVEGVLVSAYLAVVLYGGVRVLRTALLAALRSQAVQRLGFVRRHGEELAGWVRRLIHAGAFAAWGYVTLGAFGLADWFFEGLGAVLDAEAKFGAVGVSLGDVLAFVLTLAAAFVLSRMLRTLLEDDVLPRLPAGRGVGLAVTSTVHYAVLLLGFLLAISAAGIDLNRVSILAGAFGVGIGFGLQNVVNNFVSGLILLYERPIHLGDTVEAGGILGEVKRIGIRSSTIRTFQGAEVIVPNGNLIADQVINWTFSDRRRRMEVKVGVAYGTDPKRVLELLVRVAASHPGVLAEPAPLAIFAGFGDSSLDFEVRAWTDRFENWFVIQSEITVGVNAALAEAGIEIPFPQRDLHLRSLPPERRDPPA